MSPDSAERVRKVVAKHLGVYESKVTDSERFIDDLGADSLDTVEPAMAFEDEFSCEIPDDAAAEIVTVTDTVNLIEQIPKRVLKIDCRPVFKPIRLRDWAPSCLWPIGDPGDADFHFCSEEKVPRKPYCPEHCARAYLPRTRDDPQAA